MRLINILPIHGSLTLLTGLHIGTGNTEMHIGGSDNPVIRHPHSNEPYIPGSSLKGKIRSLLEWRAGLAAVNGGKPMGYGSLAGLPADQQAEAIQILKLFGVSDQLNEETAKEIGPSRLSFRDSFLNPAWTNKIKGKNLQLVEVKMENTIDRVKGVAEHPRNTERVPSGAEFDFTLAVKELDKDAGEGLLDLVLIGLKLLEMDSLGGSGSRGYGQIRWQLADPALDTRLRQIKPW
ncbi:MAG: type III-A CRISPR-associated RAMP protein Csm3 [Magnetococcales bacterium]|nr:type III-A CRISPR-associated RAMP protein Csm3 [Magnetococcales bacterium]